MNCASRVALAGMWQVGIFGRKSLMVLIMVLLTSACGKPPAPPPPPPPVVEVVNVEQRDVPIIQEWVGLLDGTNNAQILAQVNGYLLKRNFKEGDLVKKGQSLYQIDPRTFKAAVDQAKGNLARQEALLKTARLDMVRVERLLPQNAVSVRDRDNAVGREAAAQAEVLAAKAALETAELQLSFTQITAPIDGIIGISTAQIGNLVGPASSTSALTTISQVNPIKAYLPLSERQYLYFARQREESGVSHRELPLELILVDGKTYPHPGRFYFADRQVDTSTGTIKVAILFDNPGNVLRPGQFARIRAEVEVRQGALLVPQRSVGDVQGSKLVAVVGADDTVHMRGVQVGETIGSQWIINAGLKPGERVVAEGLMRIRDGIKVTTKPFVEAKPAAPAAGR